MDGDVLNAILQISLLVFVVSSMLAMGLSLTVSQIIAPLRNARLVVVALVLLMPLTGELGRRSEHQAEA